MKVQKAITIIVCVLLALFLFWYLLMNYRDPNSRTYWTYKFEDPGSSRVLFVKEWADFRLTGIEFYYTTSDRPAELLLGEVDTNEYLPFERNRYKIEWYEEGVTISYEYGAHAPFLSVSYKTPG